MAGRKDPPKPLDAALRFLALRPRSEAETRRRLSRQYPPASVESVISQLKAKGLLDDLAFARFWRDNRERHRPRSRLMMRQELFQRGVDRAAIDEALEDIDDEAVAMSAGRRMLRQLRASDAGEFRSRMVAHLRRRGFGYSLAARASERLWQELPDAVDGDVDGHGQEH